MAKRLIPILGLSGLLLLHGCTTVPEIKPEPPAQATETRRGVDTGVEWVTDVSSLKTRHRFQLARYIVEVSGATRYYGGSVADIAEGARLRAVGFYRDDVVVADAIHIERLAESAPVEAATETKAPKTLSARPATGPSATETPSADAVETAPPPAPIPQPTPGEAELAESHPQPEAEALEDEPASTATPPAGAAAPRDYSQLAFDQRTLPMSLELGWTLDRQRDPVDGAVRCVLLSPAFTIFDGYYPAKAWLRINPARAWVETNSNIDTSYPEQGLRVDGGPLAAFAAELVDEQTAYTDAPVLGAMAGGRTLTVALGFWPTWPKTATQTASIDLAGFADAYAALRACAKQQQAARE